MSLYLSDPNNVGTALKLTGLAIDELEYVVKRFNPDHWRWPNQLKGELIVKKTGEVVIRHHFTKKVLWKHEPLA